MRKTLLLALVFVIFLIQIPNVLASDLSSYWVWNYGTKLYRSNATSFTIFITNNDVTDINIDLICIHYNWMPINSFSVMRVNEVVNSTETFAFKRIDLVPETAVLGQITDFVYYIKYHTVGETIQKDTGISKAPMVEVFQGRSIYIQQKINRDLMIILTIMYLSAILIIYSQREKISIQLEKHQKKLPYIIFVLCFLVYVLATNFNYSSWYRFNIMTQGFPITGDEPHYVVATHGLLMGSIHPKEYYPQGIAQHETNSTGILLYGQSIPGHPLGFSVLSIIPYAIGNLVMGSGVYGMSVFVNLLVALIVFFIYKSTLFLTNDIKISVLTSITFAFSTLLFVWSGQLFAETILSFFIMLSIYLVIFAKNKKNWIVIGFVLGIIPFFKTQTIFLSVGSVIVLLLTLKEKNYKKNLFISFMLTIILYFVYLTLFIGFTVPLIGVAAHGHETVSILGMNVNKMYFWGLFGLLIDSNSGVLFYSPILIISILGIFRLLKQKENPAKYILIFIFLFWFGAISITEYWNGWLSPPGRYMIVILPLAFMPFALGVQLWIKNRIFWVSYVILFFLGMVMNGLMAFNRIFDYITNFDWYGGHTKLIFAISSLFNINIMYFPDFSWYPWDGKDMFVHYCWAIGLILIIGGLLGLAYLKFREDRKTEIITEQEKLKNEEMEKTL